MLWLELCDMITKHPREVHGTGLRVDAIIRGGIRRFTDEVGAGVRAWGRGEGGRGGAGRIYGFSRQAEAG